METIQGRVTNRRPMAKTTFINVGKLQVMYPTEKWDIRIGDIVQIKGEMCKTKTGETTLRASEILYHQKGNSERQAPKLGNLIRRHEIIQTIRNFFINLGYIEVDTNILLNYSQGCNSKTFTTEDWHKNGYQLRVAHEIGLKILLLKGYDKIFTIGKCFRNEGVDKTHNPEFTMLEAYQKWANKDIMLDLTKQLLNKFNLNDFQIKDSFPSVDFPLAESINGIASVWDLEINGVEIATGATEKVTGYYNAPELQAIIDIHGMEPSAGVGIGIDRLVMEVLKLDNIQDSFS